MTIIYKNFKLIPGMYANDGFDLIMTSPLIMQDNHLMREKYGDVPIGTIVGEKEDELAYDIPLEHAVKMIIMYLLAEKEDTTDLKGYLKAYKEEKIELEKAFTL
jgi:hypothetical protein